MKKIECLGVYQCLLFYCQGLALDPLSDIKVRAKETMSDSDATSPGSKKSSSDDDITNLDTNATIEDGSDSDGTDLEMKAKVKDEWILIESHRHSRNKRSGS